MLIYSHLLIDHAMGDDHSLVIAAGSKERISKMESNTANCIAMESHGLVGLCGQIQIEPEHLFVIGGHQQIVALGMNRHARYPFGVGQQLLDKLLFDQIINANVVLRL